MSNTENLQGDLSLAELGAMISAVERAIRGVQYSLKNGRFEEKAPGLIASKKGDLAALKRLRNLLVAQENRTRIAQNSRCSGG